MSLFNALDEQERNGKNQGWSYSIAFNRNNSNVLNSSSSSVEPLEEWHPLGAHQQTPSSVSSFGPGDHFVHEVKSSDTDDDLMMVDEPGVVLGGEETVGPQPTGSVMASPGYPGYGQNMYNMYGEVGGAYSQGQFLEHHPSLLHASPAPQLSSNQVPQHRHMQLPLHVHEDYAHPPPPQSHAALQQQQQQQQQQQSQQQQSHLSHQHPSLSQQQHQQSVGPQSRVQHQHPSLGQPGAQHQSFASELTQQPHGHRTSFGSEPGQHTSFGSDPGQHSSFGSDPGQPSHSQHSSFGSDPGQQHSPAFGQQQQQSHGQHQSLNQHQSQLLTQQQLYSRQSSLGQQQRIQQELGQQSVQQSFSVPQSFQPHSQQPPVSAARHGGQPDQKSERNAAAQQNKSAAQGMLRQMLNGPTAVSHGSTMPGGSQQYQHDRLGVTGNNKHSVYQHDLINVSGDNKHNVYQHDRLAGDTKHNVYQHDHLNVTGDTKHNVYQHDQLNVAGDTKHNVYQHDHLNVAGDTKHNVYQHDHLNVAGDTKHNVYQHDRLAGDTKHNVYQHDLLNVAGDTKHNVYQHDHLSVAGDTKHSVYQHDHLNVAGDTKHNVYQHDHLNVTGDTKHNVYQHDHLNVAGDTKHNVYQHDLLNVAGDTKHNVYHFGQRGGADQHMLQQQQHVYTQHQQQQQQQMSPLQMKPNYSPSSGCDFYSRPLPERDVNGRFKTKDSDQYFVQSPPTSSQSSPQMPSHNTNPVSFQGSQHSSQNTSLQSSPLVSHQNSPLLPHTSPPVMQNRLLQNSRVHLLGSPQMSVQTSSSGTVQSSPQLSLQSSPQLSSQSSPQLPLHNSPQMMHMQALSHPPGVYPAPQLVHNAPQGVLNTSQGIHNASQGIHSASQGVPPGMQALMTTKHNVSQPPGQVSQQGDADSPGGGQFAAPSHSQQPIPADIKQLLHLPADSNMMVMNRNMPPRQQENTYYSVQHNGGGSSSVLYNGSEMLHQPNEQEPKVEPPKKKRQSKPKAKRGAVEGRGNEKSQNATGLHLPTNPQMVEELAAERSEVTAPEICNEDPLQQEATPTTPYTPQGSHSPMSEFNSSDSPPSVVVAPRLSATNDIWPTPMPSQQPSDMPDLYSPPSFSTEEDFSPPALPVQTLPPPPPPVPVPPTPTPEQRREEQRRKHKLKDGEEGTALCNYCGYSSSDFEVCEGCSRKLPGDVKVLVKRRKVEPPPQPLSSHHHETHSQERSVGGGKGDNRSPPSSPPPPGSGELTLDKKSFYSSKLSVQGAAFSSKMKELGGSFSIKGSGRTFSRGRGAGRGSGRGRKSKVAKEPVTLTISSDEEDVPGPSGEAGRRLMGGTGHDEDDGGFFPTGSHLAKPSSFGTSRRAKMADAAGQCAKSTIPTVMLVNDGVYFNVRGVRIGSMRTTGMEVRFMTRCIQFRVIGDRTQEEIDFFVYVADITHIKFSLNQSQPVAFIKVTPGCGARLRGCLKMKQGEGSAEYFDPGSQDQKKNMIVVIIETVINDVGLRQTLSDYAAVQHQFTDFLHEISYDDANDLLVKSTPGVLYGGSLRGAFNLKPDASSLQGPATPSSSLPPGDGGDSCGGALEGRGGEEDGGMSHMGDGEAESPVPPFNPLEDRASRSPSPRIGFVGPVEKLLTYPSQATKGAITITNEDLYCLNEGEFLNDVIIDFYLKYVFLEKLGEDMQSKTQIFSSFFFKRLTQRDSKSLQEPTEVKLSPAQKRHARVKRWTRHVDIFSKDFLFIPINEHSHWYLAVICFPGLESQEHISYLPASPTEDDAPHSGDSNSPENPSQSPKEDESKETGSDSVPSPAAKGNHVLGKVISAEVAKKCKAQFNLGVRQPCILIMDSLTGPPRNSVIRILKDYLQVEWDLKKETPRNLIKTLRGCCPKVPQQTNYSDCGVFVLQYAETFFQNPIASFSVPMKLDRWFALSKMDHKREEIRNLILRLNSEGSNR